MMATSMRLASAGDDIKLWKCDGYVLDTYFNPHDGSNVCSICWSHDNSVLASASLSGDKIVMTYPDQNSFTYSVAEGQSIQCLAFNSTSRYVMGGSLTGLVHIWDLKSKSLKKTYHDHRGPISALQFNWNDTVVASGSESGEILLYNVVSGVCSSPLVGAKAQAVRCVQYSHFKKSLLGSCSDSGGVFLWDANKRQLLNSFTSTHLSPAMAMAFSPLNEMLLMSVGLDKRIVCYDVQGKSAVQTMVAESPLTSVDLMHDGVTLAVGSTRGKIYIYDLRKGSEILRTISAHKSSIPALRFQYKSSRTAEGSSSKAASLASRTKAQPRTGADSTSIPPSKSHASRSNGTLSATYPEVYENGDRNALLHTSPANLGVPNSHSQNGEGVFSPIRERLSFNKSNSLLKYATGTPKGHESTGDFRISHGKNSSINSFADGMFSPLASANNSGKSSLGATNHSFGLASSVGLRRQPLGGASGDPYEADINTEEDDLDENEAVEDYLGQSARRQGNGSAAAPGDDRLSPTAEQHIYSRQSVNRRSGDSFSPASQRQAWDAPTSPNSGSGDLARTHAYHASRTSPRSPGVSSRQRKAQSPDSGSAVTGAPSRTAVIVPTLPTPPEATPAGADVGTTLSSFHTEFIRHVVEEALDDFREQLRQDVLNLHLEMIKQFQAQQEEMRQMFEQYSLNGHLLEEVERLREENKRLKKTY